MSSCVETFHSTRTLLYVAWLAAAIGVLGGQLVVATYRPDPAPVRALTPERDEYLRVPGAVRPINTQCVEV